MITILQTHNRFEKTDSNSRKMSRLLWRGEKNRGWEKKGLFFPISFFQELPKHVPFLTRQRKKKRKKSFFSSI